MLPDIGGLEWLVIAVVALLVIGPRDLPMMMRKAGEFMAKVRAMAADFRASFDEMARQSELDELRKEVEAMRRGQFGELSAAENEMKTTIGEIDQALSDVGVQLHPPMSYQYGDTIAPPLETPAAEPVAIAAPEPKPRKTRTPRPKADGSPAPRARAPRKPKPIVEGGS